MPNKIACKSLLIGAISVVFIGAGSRNNTFAQSEPPVSFADIGVCLSSLIAVPDALQKKPKGRLDQQPVVIDAAQIESGEGQEIIFNGNARIIQGNRGIYADNIVYNQQSYTAKARGNVRFYTPNGDQITAESMHIAVDTFIGDAEQVGIKIADRRNHKFGQNYYQRARARGKSMQFKGKDVEVIQNAVMTTCPQGNQDVTLSAKALELDHAAGIGTAKSITVRLKNIPIFYFPLASFPINDQRKTGFLFPSFGAEQESGFIITAPYYINIAPNMDATLIPAILTKRGLQLYSEFRYLGTRSEGMLKGEYLPSDNVFNNQDRYAFGLDHTQSFANYWNAEVDLQKVSDSNYLNDFASKVDIVAASYVPQRARLYRHGRYLNFNARAQRVESVNGTITQQNLPYALLPKVNLDLKAQQFGWLQGGVNTEFTRFAHDYSGNITGSRTVFTPFVSLPLEQAYGYLKPKVSLQNTRYSLDNFDEQKDSSPSASIPVFSVDGSLIFERLFESGGAAYLQTLEPRIFYVNIPQKTNQNAFPIFDTSASAANSFGHLFRENRFFGNDRIGDTEQVTLGLSSRIINGDTDKQRLKLSVGQIIYLADRSIQLPTAPASPDKTTRSDLVGEITINPNADWSIGGFSAWDTDQNQLKNMRLSANYYHSERRNALVAYSEVRNLNQQQIKLDFETPINAQWQLGVSAHYSFEDSGLHSSSVDLGYDGCCWAAKVATQRYLDGAGKFKNRILFTLELDDLGRIGSNR